MDSRGIVFSIFFIVLFSFFLLKTSLAQSNWANAPNVNSKNVILIGTCEIPGYAKSVAIRGWYAYVADSKEGLRIISLKNPFNPKEIGFIKFPESTLDLKVKGKLAFVSLDHGLRIVDISQPHNPKQISQYNIEGWAEGLDLKDNYIYLTDAPGKLHIINVINPYNPFEVGNYSDLLFPSDVEVNDNYAYVADENSLQVIDISDPSNPKFANNFETFAYYLDIRDNLLYLVDYHNYLKIFDIKNTPNINLVSEFKTKSFPSDVSASYKFAYVADSPAGMRTIDISNPFDPKEVGYYDNENIRAYGVTSFGRIVFVAGGDKLYILINMVHPWSLDKYTSDLENKIIRTLNESNFNNNFTLYQNYPNPFNPTTTIKYEIPIDVRYEIQVVRLVVYDILGREVAILINENQKSGYYEVVWDAINQPSGIYFFRIQVGDFIETKKMIVLN